MEVVKILENNDEISSTTKLISLMSCFLHILIVFTGGLVRLTDSGLGCPTWPKCTHDSMVNIPELGIHGFIEFGNRLLSLILSIISVLMIFSIIHLRKKRNDVWKIATFLIAGIAMQAIIGGITVLTYLNSWIVNIHFLISMILVSLSIILINRIYKGPYKPAKLIDKLETITIVFICIFGIITIIVGTFVAGLGPHSGDINIIRNYTQLSFVISLHKFFASILLFFTIISIYKVKNNKFIKKPLIYLFIIEILQIFIGSIQSYLQLPILLVSLHMLLASIFIVTLTYIMDKYFNKNLQK